VDVEDAVKRMRVVREFRDEPLAEGDLTAILDAGRHTGSSKNLQRWHFVVVRDRQQLKALTGVGHFAAHVGGAAAAIAIVTPDPRAQAAPLSVTWDSGRAAQNMMLIAWARGIGSAPATVYDQALCRTILGFPPDQHCEYVLSFGYPADEQVLRRPPRAGGRVALDELVFEERWGRVPR
jgi:nitroreductase